MLSKTGHCLSDVGRVLSWDALNAFLIKPEIDSELFREIDPEMSKWCSAAKTNAILADIYDVLAMLNANLIAIGSGKQAKKPKPYARPGDKDKKKIGKNAIPISDFKNWLNGKRKKRGEK